MTLNLKNLILGGVQKNRYLVRRKEPQISVAIIENKGDHPDLIVGPIFTGNNQPGITRIEIKINCQLPAGQKLKIQLVDSQSDWPLKEITIQNELTTKFQIVIGDQKLNLKFRLKSHQDKAPKTGLTYYIKSIQVKQLNTLSSEPFIQAIVIDHQTLIKSSNFQVNKELRATDLEPVIRRIIDPQPNRSLFLDTELIEYVNVVPANEIDQSGDEYDQSGDEYVRTDINEQTLIKNQSEWETLQIELQSMVDRSLSLVAEIDEIRFKLSVNPNNNQNSQIIRQLRQLEILIVFKKRLLLEFHQIEVVLLIHQEKDTELSNELNNLLSTYGEFLKREILKIEVLIESCNHSLTALCQFRETKLNLETEFQRLSKTLQELTDDYQKKIEIGREYLKTHKRMLIKPVVTIHQMLVSKLN